MVSLDGLKHVASQAIDHVTGFIFGQPAVAATATPLGRPTPPSALQSAEEALSRKAQEEGQAAKYEEYARSASKDSNESSTYQAERGAMYKLIVSRLKELDRATNETQRAIIRNPTISNRAKEQLLATIRQGQASLSDDLMRSFREAKDNPSAPVGTMLGKLNELIALGIEKAGDGEALAWKAQQLLTSGSAGENLMTQASQLGGAASNFLINNATSFILPTNSNVLSEMELQELLSLASLKIQAEKVGIPITDNPGLTELFKISNAVAQQITEYNKDPLNPRSKVPSYTAYRVLGLYEEAHKAMNDWSSGNWVGEMIRTGFNPANDSTEVRLALTGLTMGVGFLVGGGPLAAAGFLLGGALKNLPFLAVGQATNHLRSSFAARNLADRRIVFDMAVQTLDNERPDGEGDRLGPPLNTAEKVKQQISDIMSGNGSSPNANVVPDIRKYALQFSALIVLNEKIRQSALNELPGRGEYAANNQRTIENTIGLLPTFKVDELTDEEKREAIKRAAALAVSLDVQTEGQRRETARRNGNNEVAQPPPVPQADSGGTISSLMSTSFN
jgi:hypothetical protein